MERYVAVDVVLKLRDGGGGLVTILGMFGGGPCGRWCSASLPYAGSKSTALTCSVWTLRCPQKNNKLDGYSG